MMRPPPAPDRSGSSTRRLSAAAARSRHRWPPRLLASATGAATSREILSFGQARPAQLYIPIPRLQRPDLQCPAAVAGNPKPGSTSSHLGQETHCRQCAATLGNLRPAQSRHGSPANSPRRTPSFAADCIAHPAPPPPSPRPNRPCNNARYTPSGRRAPHTSAAPPLPELHRRDRVPSAGRSPGPAAPAAGSIAHRQVHDPGVVADHRLGCIQQSDQRLQISALQSVPVPLDDVGIRAKIFV